MHYVYVLRSLSDNGLYIGYSSNLRRRVTQHNEGASFATSSRGPWQLIYLRSLPGTGRCRGPRKVSKEWRWQALPPDAASSLLEEKPDSRNRVRKPHVYYDVRRGKFPRIRHAKGQCPGRGSLTTEITEHTEVKR
jgi:predicted GIY-YIG superfamily endonuclease